MFRAIQAQLSRCAPLFCIAFAASVASASAETTVRMMHVDPNPKNVAVWREIADQFEASHPGTKVKLEYLENEAFKAKLPTLLQSKDAPDLFYSWSGGVLKAQAEAGVVKDLSKEMQANGGAWAKSYVPAAMNGVTINGKPMCVPFKLSVIGFFYNKALFKKAGVDAEAIATWDDLTAAVKKLKAAGVTPISVGAGDKWPLHFYWSYLALRLGGEEAFAAAKAGKDGGFTAKPFVQASTMVQEFGKLEPFQPGYLGTKWLDSLGMFADQRAAMLLTFDDSAKRQVAVAADGKGIPLDDLGVFPFPSVKGGKGDGATFGGVNCWAVSRNASPEALEFAKFLTGKEAEQKMAEAGMIIPAAAGADVGIKDPFMKLFAGRLAKSPFHQIYLDQDLGPSVGRVVNDVTVEVVSGAMTPEKAVKQIQEAFELEK